MQREHGGIGFDALQPRLQRVDGVLEPGVEVEVTAAVERGHRRDEARVPCLVDVDEHDVVPARIGVDGRLDRNAAPGDGRLDPLDKLAIGHALTDVDFEQHLSVQQGGEQKSGERYDDGKARHGTRGLGYERDAPHPTPDGPPRSSSSRDQNRAFRRTPCVPPMIGATESEAPPSSSSAPTSFQVIAVPATTPMPMRV